MTSERMFQLDPTDMNISNNAKNDTKGVKLR